MHIGFDAKRAFHNHSGLGNYSRTLIDNLSQFYPELNLNLFSPRGIKVEWQCNAPRISPTVGVPSALWRRYGIAFDSTYQKLDIFHGLSHELPYEFLATRVRKIVTIHDLIAIKKIEQFPLIDRYIYRKKIEHALDIADCVIAISQQTKDDIMEIFSYSESKIQVIYQSCHPDYFSNFSSQKQKYLLYVGAFRERKNVLNLIRAFKHILAKHADYSLRLVGSGNKAYCEQMTNLITSLDLDAQVTIEFSPDFEQLKKLYREAKLLIYPSLYEGFGIPIIEAINSGTPVVTTKNSCMQEAGGAGGVYCDPLDCLDIATKVNEVLASSELYQLLVKNGQKHMQIFTAENSVKQLYQLYQDVSSQ